MNNDGLILWTVVPLALAVGIPAFGFLSAAVGGWRALARHYAASEPFYGNRFWFRSGQLGLISYGACLMPGANMRGIYLSVFFPLRIGHPPIMVPWQDVSLSKAHSILVPAAELRFARAPGGFNHHLAATCGLVARSTRDSRRE